MSSPRQIPRVRSAEIKLLIVNKLGKKKAESYFHLLKKLLSLKITKVEFDRLCCATIGKENVPLHNLLIRTILKNACAPHPVTEKETNTGFSRSSKISTSFSCDASRRRVSVCGSGCRKLKDRPSPLGRDGKVQDDGAREISNPCDSQRPQELISIGSKAFVEVVSVEDGEEVEQVRGSPGVQSKSPVCAPLGIPTRRMRIDTSIKGFGNNHRLPLSETCCRSYELPDSKELRKMMECKLDLGVLSLSVGAADVMNNALDCYLKRMIKPCVELARARISGESSNPTTSNVGLGSHKRCPKQCVQGSNVSCLASLQDFRVAMESNPVLLGNDWPLWLERISLRNTDVREENYR